MMIFFMISSTMTRMTILKITANCKVLGRFKDECGGRQPLEFVGLRAKMYSLLMPSGTQKATAKGIKQAYAKKHLLHKRYYECLMEHVKTKASYFDIRSSNHKLQTMLIEKDALNPFDDKRYLLDYGVDTLAYGHCRLRTSQDSSE